MGRCAIKYINDEILFKNHTQAALHEDLLRRNGFMVNKCLKCGINFGSADPYTSDAGIICRVCVKTMNLSLEDNYRPDWLEGEEDDMFESYDDNKHYGGFTYDN